MINKGRKNKKNIDSLYISLYNIIKPELKRPAESFSRTEKENIKTILNILEKKVLKDAVLLDNLKKEMSNVFTSGVITDEELNECRTEIDNIIKQKNEEFRIIRDVLFYKVLEENA